MTDDSPQTTADTDLNVRQADDPVANADTDDEAEDTATDATETTGIITDADAAQGQQAVEDDVSDEALRDEGREEAQRHLNNSEGATERDVVENALQSVTQELAQVRQQLQQTSQQQTEVQNRYDALGDTREAVENAPDDRELLQTYEGGISVPRPPEERDEIIAELEDERASLTEELDAFESRVETLTHALKKAQYARQALQSKLDALSAASQLDASPDSPGNMPR